MIAQELEVSLHMAFVEARQKRHEFITVEHLLLALLDNPTAAEVLRACGANMDELRKNLTQHIAEQTPRIAADREVDTQPTLGFQRVIQRAILHVQSSGKKEVTGANVLVAIFGEKDSHAVYFLQQQGIARLDVVNYISHGITKTPQAHQGKNDQESEQEGQAETSNSPLDNYTQNLNALALAGKIDPLDRPRHASSSAWCRRSAAGARTIRCWSARPASARPPSPKAWRGASSRATSPTCSRSARSTRSTWARSSPAPSTAAISSSA